MVANGGGHIVGVVAGVHGDGQPNLLHVGRAGDGAGLLARLGEGGEQHRGEDGDDGDDDEELDESERTLVAFHGVSWLFFWEVMALEGCVRWLDAGKGVGMGDAAEMLSDDDAVVGVLHLPEVVLPQLLGGHDVDGEGNVPDGGLGLLDQLDEAVHGGGDGRGDEAAHRGVAAQPDGGEPRRAAQAGGEAL